MKLSIIVPLFNQLSQTQAMLASLRHSLPADLEHEIVLVDDGSTDGTRPWLATLQDPGVVVVLNADNMGYAGANNAGVRRARGEYLALLNNDLLLTPGWLEPMLDALGQGGPRAGVIGNVQLRVDDGSVDHAGVVLSPRAQFEHVLARPGPAQAAQRVLAVTGACMVLRRSDFEAVNGFDEAYRNGCEDLDLCFKLRARGQHAWLAGSSCIRHHVSLSRGRSSLQNLANSRLLFSRWRPLVQATLAGVWRQLLAAGEPAWRPYLRSRFTASAMRAPHALAGLVAQAMIHREEQHWARMLDGEGEASLAGCVWGSGQPAAAPGLPWTGLRRRGRLWLSATGIDSARNLQLRGRIVQPPGATQARALALSVNGLVEQTRVIDSGADFVIGLQDPLILAGRLNRFDLTVHQVGTQGQLLGLADDDLLLTHVVLDGQIALGTAAPGREAA